MFETCNQFYQHVSQTKIVHTAIAAYCVIQQNVGKTDWIQLLTLATTCHDVMSTSLKWRPTFDRELTRYIIGPEPLDDCVCHVSSTPLLCGLSSSIGIAAAFGIPVHILLILHYIKSCLKWSELMPSHYERCYKWGKVEKFTGQRTTDKVSRFWKTSTDGADVTGCSRDGYWPPEMHGHSQLRQLRGWRQPYFVGTYFIIT